MSFKTLHQFQITVDREVTDTIQRTEGGKQITETSTVTRPVQVTLLLKEPSRKEKQDLSLWQGVSYNEAINLGFLPRLIMAQKLSKDPLSPLSGSDDQNLAAMQARLQELSNDYIRLGVQSEASPEETETRKRALSNEWTALTKKVTDIETSYQSVFAYTAEQYRDNKTLTWLTLFLTYLKVGPDKYEPLFKGADFKAKEEALGELEDGKDPIYLGAVERLSTYWVLYLFGRASTPEQFAKVEETWKREMEVAKKVQEEREKVEREAEAALSVGAAVVETAPAAPPASETAPSAAPQGEVTP